MLECSLPARNHQRGTSTWVPSPRPSTQTDGSLEATIHVTVWRRLGLERAAERSVPTSRDGYRTLAPGPNPEIRNCHAFAKPWTIRPLASATNVLTVEDPGLPDEGKIQIAAEDTLPQESSPSMRTAHRCKPSDLPRRENMQMATPFLPSHPENAQDRTAPVRETTADLDG